MSVLEKIIKQYLMTMRPKVGSLFLEKVYPSCHVLTGQSIDVIFSNIEQLHTFHVKFLDALEKAGDDVGACFERHAEGFKIYSIYCGNFPRVRGTRQCF